MRLWITNGGRCPHCGITGRRCWLAFLLVHRCCCDQCSTNGAKSTHYRD